jgi:hypothetical protein
MALAKKQKEAVLKWIAEGLKSSEINKRAAKFKPPFKVSRRALTYYRNTRQVRLQQIKESGEVDSLSTGLAIRGARVSRLQALADLLINDLFEKGLLWTDDVKGIGGKDNFERIDFKVFNKAEVEQLRGVLDDIASEMGERLKKDPEDREGKFTAPQIVEIIRTYEKDKKDG